MACGAVPLTETGRVGSSGNGGPPCALEWRLEVEASALDFLREFCRRENIKSTCSKFTELLL